MKKSTNIDFFFNPKSIAIIGASPNSGKPSYVILESLKKMGFPGDIHPVNPKYRYINGLKCYGAVSEINTDIDLAVIAVPAPSVPTTLRDVGEKVRGVIVISAGFKEVGDEGKKLEEEVKRTAKKEGIRVIGPNCMGIYDTISRIDTFFIPGERIGRPKKGGISILSQSGSFAATIMDELSSEEIGVARVVSYGNRVDVGESDCLEFLADDEYTRVVALYIESVDDGRRFLEAAARCTKRKPVVAVKVGKMEAGVHAARSHTGAMTGQYEIYRAAFKKAGIIEVDGYEGLKDACKALNIYDQTRGKRVLIVSDGGGIGVRIADACAETGLEVTPLSGSVRKSLTERFPAFYGINNPIDLTGSATDGDYVTALREGLKGGYNMAILAVLWGPPRITEGLVDMLSGAIKASNKPVVICSPGGRFTMKMNRAFGDRGIPVFASPESAIRAASVLAKG